MDYSFCPMSPARDYTAATLRNPALDDENMEVIAQMDAVAPLVAQAYLLTTGCALRASRRAAHAPKRDPLHNSCQFERLVRNIPIGVSQAKREDAGRAKRFAVVLDKRSHSMGERQPKSRGRRTSLSRC